jgi:ubiquinone biosynthesis protein UbiJ
MLAATAISAFAEEVGNRLLRLDPDTLDRLAALEGRVVCIELTAPALRLYLLPWAGGLRVQEHWEGPPDVCLRGSLAGFGRLARAAPDPSIFADGALCIEGDTELGQRFAAVLRRLDIDWEELASRALGDPAAHRLGVLARAALDWVSEAAAVLGQNAREYAQQEQAELPAREQVESFMRQVDVLRADADRLEQRIDRLRRAIP